MTNERTAAGKHIVEAQTSADENTRVYTFISACLRNNALNSHTDPHVSLARNPSRYLCHTVYSLNYTFWRLTVCFKTTHSLRENRGTRMIPALVHHSLSGARAKTNVRQRRQVE